MSQFPQHQGVDFGSLVVDESLLDVATSSSLLPSFTRPQLETEKGEWVPEQVVEEPDLALSPAGRLKKEELSETYPSLDTLFSDESIWTEEGGARYIERKQIEGLLAKKDPSKPISDSHKSWLVTQLWNEWKKLEPEQTGRLLSGRGHKIFLSSEEAVNLLWFMHNTTQEPTSTFRNYTFIGAITSATEDSKKK